MDDDLTTSAPPLLWDLPTFDLIERLRWDRYKEQNAAALDTQIDFIRQNLPAEYVEAAIQDLWHYARLGHREEAWRSVGAEMADHRPATDDGRDSRIAALEAENDQLQAERDDAQLKVIELESALRRKNEEGDRQFKYVQQLEAALSNHQARRVCGCGHMTYTVWCPKCGDEWQTWGADTGPAD